MKFNISKPPCGGDDLNDRLSRLTSWLLILSESLNVTLSNLGEENFSQEVRTQIFNEKEEGNDNT